MLDPAEHQKHLQIRRQELLLSSADSAQKQLKEEGLGNPEEFGSLGPTVIETAVNVAYRSIVNANNRLRRLKELSAPESVLGQFRKALGEACEELNEKYMIAVNSGRFAEPVEQLSVNSVVSY